MRERIDKSLGTLKRHAGYDQSKTGSYLVPIVGGKNELPVYKTKDQETIESLKAEIKSLEESNLMLLKSQSDVVDKQCALDKISPRLWDQDLIDAWHKNIPDIQKAFDAITGILKQRIRKGG